MNLKIAGMVAAVVFGTATSASSDEQHTPTATDLTASSDQTVQPIAYDVIMVPRPAGSTRSRMFTGDRWVILPNIVARPDGRPVAASPADRRAADEPPRDYRSAQRQWESSRRLERTPRWSTRHEDDRAQRRFGDDERPYRQRYRGSFSRSDRYGGGQARDAWQTRDWQARSWGERGWDRRTWDGRSWRRVVSQSAPE